MGMILKLHGLYMKEPLVLEDKALIEKAKPVVHCAWHWLHWKDCSLTGA